MVERSDKSRFWHVRLLELIVYGFPIWLSLLALASAVLYLKQQLNLTLFIWLVFFSFLGNAFHVYNLRNSSLITVYGYSSTFTKLLGRYRKRMETGSDRQFVLFLTSRPRITVVTGYFMLSTAVYILILAVLE